jgi:hypothetical protein
LYGFAAVRKGKKQVHAAVKQIEYGLAGKYIFCTLSEKNVEFQQGSALEQTSNKDLKQVRQIFPCTGHHFIDLEALISAGEHHPVNPKLNFGSTNQHSWHYPRHCVDAMGSVRAL